LAQSAGPKKCRVLRFFEFFLLFGHQKMDEISPKRCGNATKQVILQAFVGEESGVSVRYFKSALAVVLSKIKKGDIVERNNYNVKGAN